MNLLTVFHSPNQHEQRARKALKARDGMRMASDANMRLFYQEEDDDNNQPIDYEMDDFNDINNNNNNDNNDNNEENE